MDTRSILRRSVGAALVVFVGGFWLHRSPEDAAVLGRYDLRTFTGLAILTIGAVLALALVAASGRARRRAAIAGAAAVPRWARIGTAAVVVLAPLVAAEAVLARRFHERRSAGGETKPGELHPFLQRVPAAGDRRKTINSWGFRGEEIELRKPAGTYRIFALGGSTTYCGEVDFETSHCRLIERRLRARYPRARIEVQNAGMHWHTSAHSLFKLLTLVQDFSPDLVIVMHAVNDLARSFSPPLYARGEYRPDYGHYYGPLGPIARDYFSEEARPPRLFVLDAVLGLRLADWCSDLRGGGPPPVEEVSVREWKSLPAFTRNMRELAALVKGKGIELIVASEPSLYEDVMSPEERAACWFPQHLFREGNRVPDFPSLARGMRAFNGASREASLAAGAIFVDLEPRLPKDLGHFSDDVHYTPVGNWVVASVLAGEIIRHRLVERALPAARQ